MKWQNFRGEEWTGATLFAATAVETLLYWSLRSQLDLADSEKLQRSGLKAFVKAALSRILIIEPTATQASECADWRNLIHPEKVARTGLECNRGTALASLAALEFVTVDLTKYFKANSDAGQDRLGPEAAEETSTTSQPGCRPITSSAGLPNMG